MEARHTFRSAGKLERETHSEIVTTFSTKLIIWQQALSVWYIFLMLTYFSTAFVFGVYLAGEQGSIITVLGSVPKSAPKSAAPEEPEWFCYLLHSPGCWAMWSALEVFTESIHWMHVLEAVDCGNGGRRSRFASESVSSNGRPMLRTWRSPLGVLRSAQFNRQQPTFGLFDSFKRGLQKEDFKRKTPELQEVLPKEAPLRYPDGLSVSSSQRLLTKRRFQNDQDTWTLT